MATLGNIFAFPYAAALALRNMAYDKGWLKSVKFDNVYILSFGNITVGGTGKTPHVEMFIRELLDNAWRVAVVSRGYGRRQPKTSRFVEIDSNVEDVGDEPLQIKRKFPNVKVVVDKDLPAQLVVPKSAVVIRDGLEVLFRYRDGKAEWVYVHTLSANSEAYAVTANTDRGATLSEGEQVIVSGNLNLADGSRVVLKQ